jgi:hypothetical protein
MLEILEFFGGILLYIFFVFITAVSALTMNPRVLEIVEQSPTSGWLVVGVVFLAGVSTLLGESSILFVNRVRRSRFVVSLIMNGIIFLISYFVWGLTVYLVARVLFATVPPWEQFVRMVGLSTAPLVFGFLVLIPWMGTFIGKLLSIWSLLILTNIVQFEFQITFWAAVFCVGLGWLVSLIFSNTIGRPVVKLRNKIFQKISGSKLDVQADDILMTFAGADFNRLQMTGGEGIGGPVIQAPEETGRTAGERAAGSAWWEGDR